jgi:feruloyl esterase
MRATDRWMLGIACGLVLSGAARAADGDPARCAALVRQSFPDTKITLAQAMLPGFKVPGSENSPGGPVTVQAAFCRVAGTVAPAINFEVWMPLDGWNGRFQGLGLGALLGAIQYAPMAQSVAKGYAVASTDTGHQGGGGDASWVIGADGKLNTGLVNDWAHRGIHEMTVKSKAIVAAFYGDPAQYSYFTGCSSGGHQALTEAQRYPDDYNGILAGAPANYWTHLQAGQIAFGLHTQVDPATNLEKPIDKIELVHDAVLAACDAKDGVKDGVIENPLKCTFRPATLQCKGADSASCLTAAQVKAVEKIYADAKGADGRSVFPGFAPGSEPGWSRMASIQVPWAAKFYRHFVFQDLAWNYAKLDLVKDVALADRTVGPILNSVNADLTPFTKRGGKLIQYHGWADWGISPYNSINYFNSVVEHTGGGHPTSVFLPRTQEYYRLFMVPGMEHCRGGPGPDSFDGLGALEQWVEKGIAPDRIIASKMEAGKAIRSRPLCPYPQVAKYKGAGSTDDAASFECGLDE